ncbi:Ltp family lipoprotein [Lactococcus lactis]
MEYSGIKKAQDYLSYDSFSDAGLREQLIYEQFTSTEADYAIANINK